MSYILLLLKLLVLAVSMTGYAFWYHDKTKLNPSFLPLTVIGTITVLLYFAGLLNVLNEGVLLITLLGVSLSVYYGIRVFRRTFSLTPLITCGTVFFVVGSLLVMLLLRGTYYDHYDNFSHWAVIVREMFRTGAFPTEASAVTFQNYPPGTATFIYYVCRILGYTESYTLMAQGILIVACIAAIFYKAEAKRPLVWSSLIGVAMLVLTLPLYCSGWHMRELLVDSLLGYLTVAALIIVLDCACQPIRLAAGCWPVFCLLVLVKDSGKILWIIALVLLLVFGKRTLWKTPLSRTATIGAILLPFGSSYLWKQHVLMVYPSTDFESNKFAFTLEKLEQLINARPEGFFEALPREILTRAFDPNKLNTRLLIAAVILSASVLIWLLIRRKKTSKFVGALVFSLLFLLIYLVMLAVLYGALFTPSEAAIFGSFDRYFTTAVIVIVTLLLTAMIYTVSDAFFTRRALASGTVLAAVGVMLLIGLPGFRQPFTPIGGQSERRATIRQLYAQATTLNIDGKILLYLHDRPDASTCGYMASYEPDTNPISLVTIYSFSNTPATTVLSGGDYLFVGWGKESLFAELASQGVELPQDISGNIFRIENASTLVAVTE